MPRAVCSTPLYCSYDPSQRQWTVVANMSHKRIAAGLTVVNRFLYAVGGFDGVTRLNTMEKYYPEENRWISCPPMSTSRSGAGMSIFHHTSMFCSKLSLIWHSMIAMLF